MQSSRFYDLTLAAFVAVLLISNIASSAKIVDFGISFFGLPLAFDAGTLLFPLSYIFGDVLTEVYGYRGARRAIWTGFGAVLLLSLYMGLVGWLPGAGEWQGYAGDASYNAILGGVSSGGILLASLTAYLAGEFSNARTLLWIRRCTGVRFLWMRTIGSTLIGQALDTGVFVLVACMFGVFPWSIALSLIVANYLFKVGIEVLCTPGTYWVVGVLKRGEREEFIRSS